MQIKEPKVAFVAASDIEREGLEAYLEDIGAPEFELNAPSGAEQLVTIGGKLCYKSFAPGLNPNVSKVRNDNEQYIGNINKVGHGSVVEHANVSFIFWNVSRVFTHELVRHRAGTAMSQESLRYVRLTDLSFWVPQIIDKHDNEKGEGRSLMLNTVIYLEEVQKKLAEIYGIEDIKNFGLKKKLTSAFRRVAPIGLGTAIMWTMNLRAARHLIQIRTSRHAEEEIRMVFDQVAQTLVEKYPNMFQDFDRSEVDGHGEWVAEHASMPYDSEKITKLKKQIEKLKTENRGLRAAQMEEGCGLKAYD